MAVQWYNFPVLSNDVNRPTPKSIMVVRLPNDCFDKSVSFDPRTDSIRIYMSLVVIDKIYNCEQMFDLGMLEQLLDKETVIMYSYTRMAKQLITMAAESNFV